MHLASIINTCNFRTNPHRPSSFPDHLLWRIDSASRATVVRNQCLKNFGSEIFDRPPESYYAELCSGLQYSPVYLNSRIPKILHNVSEGAGTEISNK